MKFCEARQGRVFVIRLEDGEILHEQVERFAREHGIHAATVIAVGGADCGSKLVVGPERGRASPVIPIEHTLSSVHEIVGVGTLFPDESGGPALHMHAACGRADSAVTGCVRRGIRTWHVIEVIITELLDCRAARRPDSGTGFHLLEPA